MPSRWDGITAWAGPALLSVAMRDLHWKYHESVEEKIFLPTIMPVKKLQFLYEGKTH